MGTRRRRRVLVVGLGNVLLADDGVGVHAVRQLLRSPPPGARVVEVGTAVLDALHLLEAADRVLAIDAMQAGRPPGTIYACRLEDVAAPGETASMHEMNLRAILHFLPEDRRPHIRVLGVEPERIDYSMELSAAVQGALPRLLGAVRDTVGAWTADAPDPAPSRARPGARAALQEAAG